MAENWGLNIIREKRLLLVEGLDEKNFFQAFLKHLQISYVQIESVGGKDQFANRFPRILKVPGFSQVEFLAVIRDADQDAQAAFQSIVYSLKKYDLPAPENPEQFIQARPSVGIFIMPGSSEQGMLEDLCLKTVAKHPAMKCVDQFSNCMEHLPDPPKVMAKARAHAFLSAMPKLIESVGRAAESNYWDFHSEELANLQKFLIELR
ncbi:MAG: hypothetical protein HUU50_22065 [Candidatus Brocadiae bacterium]|nr:hypothetical protein [Candidatus Brocadiia bacterium]